MLAALGIALYALSEQRRAARPRSTPVARIAAPPGQESLEKVGVVRFNPYRDTGGEYSFSVALLDRHGTGVLLTGLYHRESCRVFAKEVRGWRSELELMDEERLAIERARDDGAMDTSSPPG